PRDWPATSRREPAVRYRHRGGSRLSGRGPAASAGDATLDAPTRWPRSDSTGGHGLLRRRAGNLGVGVRTTYFGARARGLADARRSSRVGGLVSPAPSRNRSTRPWLMVASAGPQRFDVATGGRSGGWRLAVDVAC